MSAVPNHVIDDSFLHLLPNGTFLLIGTILAYQKRVGKRILWIILRKSSQEQEHSAINLENVRKVFFSNSSRDDANLRMEIDFLIAKSKISSRHDISLIEVKSGKNDTLTSLRKFQKKYKEQLYIPYLLHTGELKEEAGIVYLPLYMTPLL